MLSKVLKRHVLEHQQRLWSISKTLPPLSHLPNFILSKNCTTKTDNLAEIKDALAIERSMFSNSAGQRPKMHSQSPTTIDINNNNKVLTNARKQYKNKIQTKLTPSEPRFIEDTELGLKYHRLQLNDPILNKLMTLVRSRKRRQENAPIVIEGHRHIRDALSCQLHMETLIFSKREELKKINLELAKIQGTQKNLQVYKVPQHDLKIWSTLTTPPGLMAIFRRPGLLPLSTTAPALPITVICDNIREPNNLGSIIRTCAALPCQQVIVTHGCCDPWESKALRGGCGGHYRVPICDGILWKELPNLFAKYNNNLCIYIAENNMKKLYEHKQQAIDYANMSRVGEHNIVIIGGESHGVSDDAYNFLNNMKKEYSSCLFIPVADGVDSLNVASALTLIIYELRKNIIGKIDIEGAVDNAHLSLRAT